MGHIANGDTLGDLYNGLYAQLDGSDRTLVQEGRVKVLTAITLAGPATAATPQAEVPLGALAVPTPLNGTANPRPYRIVGATFTSNGALAFDPTNNATLNIITRDATGTVTATAATVTTTATGTGTLVQYQTVAIPVTAANAIVPAGGSVSYSIAKGGSGVAVTAGGILTVFAVMA